MIRVMILYSLYSSSHVSGSSRFNLYSNLIRSIEDRYPGQFYWIFPGPREGSGVKFTPLEGPNVECPRVLGSGQDIKSDVFSGYDGVMPHPDLLEFYSKNYHRIDVVLNSDYLYSGLMELLTKYESSWFYMYPKVVRPVVVSHITETGNDDKLPHLSNEMCRYFMLSQVSRGIPGMVFSDLDRKFVLQAASSLLSPSLRARVDLRVIPPILETKKILSRMEEYQNNRKSLKEMVFFHGGTFEAKRHILDMEEFVKELYEGGNKVKLLLCSQKDKPPKKFPSFVDVRCSVFHDQFLDLLGCGSTALCFNDYEGTGLSYFETILSGMVGIFMKSRWLEGRVPLDYPFLVGTKREFIEAMKLTVKNPDRAKEIGKGLLDFVKEHFDQDRVAEEYVKVLRMAFQRKLEEGEELAGTHILVREAKERIAGIPIGKIFSMEEVKSWFKNKALAKEGILRNLLLVAGAEDVDCGETQFRRVR